MNSCILLPFILSAYVISAGVNSQWSNPVRLVPTSANCSNLTLVHFLSYFPCVNISSEEELKKCDIFAYVAAEMAAERINRDPQVLSSARLKLASIYNLDLKASSSSEISFDALLQILGLMSEEEVRSTLWGIVGPLTTKQASSASIFSIENAGLIMVSYTARDPGLNNPTGYQSTFYRSLPSDNVINEGKLLLLKEFEWYRIGVINSLQPPYPQMVENFQNWLSFYYNETNEIEVAVQESFTGFDDFSYLQSLRKRDIRIIVGFFGPNEARHILCVAKDYDLTTANHVWILPAYYNPDWWKSGSVCSDTEMLYILNKLVIFVDGVKFPPIDLPMVEFNSELVNKTKQLFPSLRDVDLSRYLQQSRATSAYDAVMLVAQSLDLVVDRGGDLCHDPLTRQIALERCLMDCEQCRLYSGCSTSQTFTNADCEMCSFQKSCDFNYTFDDLRRPEALNSYGQVLISQFINGRNCPISIYWDTLVEQGQLTKISNLTDHPCAGQRLGLERNETFLGIERCPTDFQWKGNTPPRSNHALYSFIPVAQFAPVAAVTLIGLMFGIAAMVFTIIWRNNRHVKVSSPRLNCVFIVGYFLLLPSTTIYNTLTLSAVVYGTPVWIHTPICQLHIWTGYIGLGLMLATLIVKNWRIYRIFHSMKLQKKSEQLSDGAMFLGILILMTPLCLMLTAWTAHSTYKFSERTLENQFPVINITSCDSKHSKVWAECTSVYLGIILIGLFLLSFASIRVPMQFSGEGRTAQRVVILNLVLIPVFSIPDVLLKFNPSLWHRHWWVSVMSSLIVPICLLGALYLPQVYSILKDHFHEKKMERDRKYSKHVSDKYANLVHEAARLKKHLEQMDEELKQLKLTSSKATTDVHIDIPPDQSDHHHTHETVSKC